MDHHHDMASLGCNGEELGHEYGSWIGHILPGALFITWGSWHMINVFWAYTHAMARDGHDARFRSQANYKLHVGAGRDLPVEAVLKVVGAVVGMSMELWTGGSYQALVCENNTAHPGWFHGDNINNWQHAILYPPILLSGLVDLLSSTVVLPRGAQHAFLTLVFLFEGLIMGAHTKPVPLDNVVHQYLAATSTTLALVTLVETFLSRHVLLGSIRSALMVLQGTWLCAIGRIMFEHRVAWDTHLMAAHDYVPVLYCWHIVFIAAGALALYTCVAMWQQYVQPRIDVNYSPLSGSGGGKDAHGLPVSEDRHAHHHHHHHLGGGGRHQRRASGSEGGSDIEMSSEVTSAGSDHESASGDHHHQHHHHDDGAGSERHHLLLGVRGSEPRLPQSTHAGRYGGGGGGAPIAL